MKQGMANSSGMGSTKREPIAHAVNPAAVSEMGNTKICGSTSTPLYEGRGLEAPMNSITTHATGSQGKYK